MENQDLPINQESSKTQGNTEIPVTKAVTQQYKPYIPRHAKPEYIAFKARVISLKGLIITILSFLLSILFTETILLSSAGISVPIFAIAFYATLFYYFKETEKPLNKTAMLLTIPVLLLAFSCFIFNNTSTQFITWLTLIGLVCIQLILLGNVQVSGVFTFDMLSKAIVNLVGKPFTNLVMPFHSFGVLKDNKSKTFKNFIYILIGLAISLPISGVLMGLFMSADAVFAEAANTVVGFLGIDFDRIFGDVLLGSIFGLFFAAILLALKYNDQLQKPPAKIGDNIESIIIGTFLTIINIFIIAFVAFQFVYLFGGSVNIQASGMSYAEYARRGFFELSAASGIIFAIALFVIIMTKKMAGKLPLWIKLTTVCLCVCNGVLLVSAVKRMLLYVDVYGLSVKRILTLWFMGIIALCLLWMVIKCFVNKLDVMKYIGLTVIVGVCILSLSNTERLIAKYNVDRYLSNPVENSIDIYYLGQLSYTVVPEIVKLKDLQEGPIKNTDIKKLLNGYKSKLDIRHSLYGFTLDSLEARSIIDTELE